VEDGEPDIDAATLTSITQSFLDDAITRCRTLRDAAMNGEAETVQQIGHYIKGGAAQLAIANVRDVASALETLARRGALDSASALVPVLEAELVSARGAVGTAVNGHTG